MMSECQGWAEVVVLSGCVFVVLELELKHDWVVFPGHGCGLQDGFEFQYSLDKEGVREINFRPELLKSMVRLDKRKCSARADLSDGGRYGIRVLFLQSLAEKINVCHVEAQKRVQANEIPQNQTVKALFIKKRKMYLP